MGQYLNALRTNILGLVRFSGRESPKMFWPYVGTVVILLFVSMFAVMFPAFIQTFAKMQTYAIKHPEDATIDQGPGHYSITIHGNHPELMPDLGPMIDAIAVMAVITVILFAAAVARRLHDTGKSGFWGILPLPFLAFSMSIMPRMFHNFMSQGQPDFSMFLAVFLSNLAYLACLAIVVILLVQKGTSGSNRFGAQEESQ